MVKVRWTQKCAGGCGEWLTAGSLATRAFGNLFCTPCVAAHDVLREADQRDGSRSLRVS
jgi:hypothetical protein